MDQVKSNQRQDETALALYRSFVTAHFLQHMFNPAPELKNCGCELGRAYRKKFYIPDPNPEWME